MREDLGHLQKVRNLITPPALRDIPTPIHGAVIANLTVRGQPVRARVDLMDANEERQAWDR